MTNKETILKTINFIENNLNAGISVVDIASEGCYSLYHFTRLFHYITGIPPKKYLLHRRLTEALYQVRDTNKKLTDIAYDYQFGSYESFSRTFSKYFGVSPVKIRKGFPVNSLQLLGPITKDYIYQSDKARNQPPELVTLENKTLAGIAFFIADDTEIKSLGKEWGQFMSQVHTIKDRVVDERYYQVQFWSDNQDLGGMYFFIGVEVDSIHGLDPQFVVKVIPKGQYLCFIHKGLANKVGYTYKYIYNQFLPGTDYKLNQPFNFEFYGEKCLGPDNEQSESEIYIPVGM